MIVRFIEFFRERMGATIRASLAVLALVVLADVLFVSKEHAHTAVERFPGFWAAFGFVACVLIIVISKWFGHLGIMTREDYYDD